jgi:hypothetical protein
MDIPNIFGGGMPSYIPGLLGQEETAALQKRANVQGLLGAALSLAQGMSPMGPRRSAAQNILGAIAGGMQAGQGAYQGAVQNYMTQQQLANAQLQQRKTQIDLARQTQAMQAVEDVIASPEVANNPTMVAYFRANPEKAMEVYLNRQMAREARGTPPQVPAQVMPQQGQIPTEAGMMPAVPVVAKASPYQSRIDEAERAAAYYGNIGTKEGTDMSAKLREEANYFRGLQRQEELVGGVSESLANVDPTLRRRAESLIANAPSLTQEQIQSRLDAILADDANLKQQLDPRLSEQRIRERKAGATIVNVGDKVLQGERAKAQSRAEESAINAQNAASDVSAIIDILRPYRGGALQDFAGSIGAYLPGTELEKLATAKQAAEAIRAKLAPTLRVEGSGATSDFEIKSFLSAIPSLFNTTEGRDLMSTYAQRLADRSVAAADIRARLTEEGRYSIKNFQEELRKSGLDRVFSNEDIQRLRGKAPVAGGLSPEGQKAFEKYRPRQP